MSSVQTDIDTKIPSIPAATELNIAMYLYSFFYYVCMYVCIYTLKEC